VHTYYIYGQNCIFCLYDCIDVKANRALIDIYCTCIVRNTREWLACFKSNCISPIRMYTGGGGVVWCSHCCDESSATIDLFVVVIQVTKLTDFVLYLGLGIIWNENRISEQLTMATASGNLKLNKAIRDGWSPVA
jgi:hypothetical protein